MNLQLPQERLREKVENSQGVFYGLMYDVVDLKVAAIIEYASANLAKTDFRCSYASHIVITRLSRCKDPFTLWEAGGT